MEPGRQRQHQGQLHHFRRLQLQAAEFEPALRALADMAHAQPPAPAARAQTTQAGQASLAMTRISTSAIATMITRPRRSAVRGASRMVPANRRPRCTKRYSRRPPARRATGCRAS